MKKKLIWFTNLALLSSFAPLAFVACQSSDNVSPDSIDIITPSSDFQENGLPKPMRISPIQETKIKYFDNSYPLSPDQKNFINQNNGKWTLEYLYKASQLKASMYVTPKVMVKIVDSYYSGTELSVFRNKTSQVVWNDKAVDYPGVAKTKVDEVEKVDAIVKEWKNNNFKLPWEDGAKLVDVKQEIIEKPQQLPKLPEPKQPEMPLSSIFEPVVPVPIGTFSKSIRIGHWNVLNLYRSYDEKRINAIKEKVNAISRLIHQQNMNLVGLTEIKNLGATELVIEKLNQLDPSAKWKFLISPYDGKSIVGTPGQREYVSIIYQSKLLEPIPFQGYETAGLIYHNNAWENPFIPKMKINYVRPPYGAKFKVIENGEDFTVVYSHSDQPGGKKPPHDVSASKYGFKNRQGLQEVNEALYLDKVMQWYDSIDGEHRDLFYMGDTNIRMGNEAKAFAPLIKVGYKSLYPESEEHKTSINDKNEYSSPYDKMFYQGKYHVANVKKMDLIKLWEQFKSPIIIKAKSISDHTMTFLDLFIKN